MAILKSNKPRGVLEYRAKRQERWNEAGAGADKPEDVRRKGDAPGLEYAPGQIKVCRCAKCGGVMTITPRTHPYWRHDENGAVEWLHKQCCDWRMIN